MLVFWRFSSAAFIKQAANFSGSHFVLVDVDAARLAVVHKLAVKMALEGGADFTITATTNRREALKGCDIALTSFRPGGFFMALRRSARRSPSGRLRQKRHCQRRL